MNGRDLTLGLIGALALGAAVRRRGTRNTQPPAEWERLIDLAPALLESVDVAYDDREDRDGATKLLASYLRANGFKVLGYGGTRVAVLLDDIYVAKVAAFDDGIRQNESESGLWGILKREAPELAEMVLPIHDVDGEGIVLLTERAKPCSGVTRKRCTPLLDAARRKLGAHALTRYLIDAEYDFNWGFHDGRLKLFDYGQ